MRRNLQKELLEVGDRLKKIRDDPGAGLGEKPSEEDWLFVTAPLAMAFEALEIEPDKDGLWLAALCMAHVIYGRHAGRPRVWSSAILNGLRKKIRGLKVKYPADSELALCKRLIDQFPELEGFSPVTLRRKLQDAKQGTGASRQRKLSRRPQKSESSAVDNDWD